MLLKKSYYEKIKFFAGLSWTGMCRPDVGIVSWKQDEASAVENKLPSLYYTFYYSPAPFPLNPVLLSRWGKKKNRSHAVSRRAAFESSVLGFRCSGWQTPALLECLPLLWHCCEGYSDNPGSLQLIFKLCEFKHFLSLTKTEKSSVPFLRYYYWKADV